MFSCWLLQFIVAYFKMNVNFKIFFSTISQMHSIEKFILCWTGLAAIYIYIYIYVLYIYILYILYMYMLYMYIYVTFILYILYI